MVLEYNAHLAPQVGDMRSVQCAEILAVYQHLAAGRPLHKHDQLEQGALAGTAVPGEEYQFICIDGEADFAERLVAPGIAFGNAIKCNHGVD